MSRPRRLQNAILAAVIVAELIVLVGHPLFGWGPTRPHYLVGPPPLSLSAPTPPDAAQALRALAAAATGTGGATGSRATTGRAPTTGRYAAVLRRTWAYPDQSVRGGRPRQPLDRTITSWWTAAGRGGSITDERVLGGGTRTVRVMPARRAPLPSLTGSATAVSRRVLPGVSGATDLGRLSALTALQPVPPALQGALLTRLARVPGLAFSGTTTDRAGRPGLAISAVSAPGDGVAVRTTLVFDARSGALLESDETLIGGDRAIDVAPGGLLGYTLILRSGRVAAIGTLPPAVLTGAGG